MDGYRIKVEDEAVPEDIQALWHNLYEFNVAQTGQDGQFISVFVRDDEGHVFGELDQIAGEHRWYFLKKNLS